jgi:hypothetical protein
MVVEVWLHAVDDTDSFCDCTFVNIRPFDQLDCPDVGAFLPNKLQGRFGWAIKRRGEVFSRSGHRFLL